MTPPETLRASFPAVLIAVFVMAVMGLAALLFLNTALSRSTPALAAATRAGAEAVGKTVAGQLSRALEIGIPLDRLQGVEPYLQGIVSGSPQVKALAVFDTQGRTLYATAPNVDGLRFPIAASGPRATLVVATESLLIDNAVRQLEIALAIAVVLIGLVAGGVVAGFTLFHERPERRRVADIMNRMAAGDLSTMIGSEGRGRFSEAFYALSLSIERIESARRRLAEAVSTLRAIDFDGSLNRRIETILAPIEGRYVVTSEEPMDESQQVRSTESALIWRVALILGLYGYGFPLVANFAVDREPTEIARAWWPILPLLAELAAAVVGVVVGSGRAGRSHALLAIAGLILGGSLAATYWCRSYDLFVLLRAVSGLGVGLIAAGLLTGTRFSLARRDAFAVVVLSMFLAGPLLSGLVTEASGRRAAFLVIGAVALVIAPFIAAGARQSGRAGAAVPITFGSALRLGLTVLPAAALMLVVIPVGFGYDNYLAGAAPMILLGLSALIASALPPLAPALVLLIAALLLYLAPDALGVLLVAAASSGFAAGAAIRAHGSNFGRPWPALAGGIGAALIATGLADHFNLPFAAVVGGTAVLLIASQLPRRLRTAGQPA